MATGSFDFLQNSSNAQASGALSGQRLIYRYLCGVSSNPTSLAWPLPSLNLMFKTDGSITDRGFNMSYNIQPCGGLLEGPQTQILSPGYPAEYPASSHCQWIIEFTEGSQIQFTANAFSVARCRPVLYRCLYAPLYRCLYASPTQPLLDRQSHHSEWTLFQLPCSLDRLWHLFPSRSHVDVKQGFLTSSCRPLMAPPRFLPSLYLTKVAAALAST